MHLAHCSSKRLATVAHIAHQSTVHGLKCDIYIDKGAANFRSYHARNLRRLLRTVRRSKFWTPRLQARRAGVQSLKVHALQPYPRSLRSSPSVAWKTSSRHAARRPIIAFTRLSSVVDSAKDPHYFFGDVLRRSERILCKIWMARCKPNCLACEISEKQTASYNRLAKSCIRIR